MTCLRMSRTGPQAGDNKVLVRYSVFTSYFTFCNKTIDLSIGDMLKPSPVCDLSTLYASL